MWRTRIPAFYIQDHIILVIFIYVFDDVLQSSTAEFFFSSLEADKQYTVQIYTETLSGKHVVYTVHSTGEHRDFIR